MIMFRCVAKCDYCPTSVEQSFHSNPSEFKKDLVSKGWKIYKSRKSKCFSCATVDAEIKDRIVFSGIPLILRDKAKIGIWQTVQAPSPLLSKRQHARRQRHKTAV